MHAMDERNDNLISVMIKLFFISGIFSGYQVPMQKASSDKVGTSDKMASSSGEMAFVNFCIMKEL